MRLGRRSPSRPAQTVSNPLAELRWQPRGERRCRPWPGCRGRATRTRGIVGARRAALVAAKGDRAQASHNSRGSVTDLSLAHGSSAVPPVELMGFGTRTLTRRCARPAYRRSGLSVGQRRRLFGRDLFDALGDLWELLRHGPTVGCVRARTVPPAGESDLEHKRWASGRRRALTRRATDLPAQLPWLMHTDVAQPRKGLDTKRLR